MTIEEHRELIKKLNSQVQGEPPIGLLRKYYSEAVYLLEDFPSQRKMSISLSTFCKQWCDRLAKYVDDEYDKLYWECLKFEGQNRVLDSYLLYLERHRLKKDQYYQPRRKCFMKIGLIQALQMLLDDELDGLTLSMPPGTGKTTLEKFFHSGICGWYPSDFNLFYSHSGDITRMYFDGMLDILTNDSEYTWGEIFPELKVQSTNAKLETINVGKYKPFPNVQCTSVGAKNAGKVRASKFLLCDDLIGGIEEALNKNTLDKLWDIYAVDARQRKIDGCKELHIATRWSVHDVIGRLQRAYAGDERWKFIAVPDINPNTGESNFMFDVNPFTVKFYNEQAAIMDDISYRCLYKNEPVEREGLLFPEDKLRRYFALPDQEPDEITGQCDCKAKGIDFMVLPTLKRYGDDYYCDAVVCDKDTDYEKQYQSLVELIISQKIQNVEFESNMGGDRVAEEVSKRLEERGWICNITTHPTESNKEARIYQCSAWILQHILFKDKSLYGAKSDYGVFMSELTTYSTVGKNVNDDVPDVLSCFALRVTGGGKLAKVEIFDRRFFRI